MRISYGALNTFSGFVQNKRAWQKYKLDGANPSPDCLNALG